jgi:hypothetical protein
MIFFMVLSFIAGMVLMTMSYEIYRCFKSKNKVNVGI